MDRAVGRRPYLSMMALLFVVVPLAEWISLDLFPRAESYLRYVNMACLCAVALLTGWRMADAGYGSWFGFLGVMIFALVGPSITLLITAALVPGSLVDSVFVLAGITLGWLLALLAFVVWAGLRPPAEKSATTDR